MMLLLALIIAFAAWAIFMFNSLVSLKNQVLNAFRQIDVQLKRRHDLIPNLVNSVKGEMKFEQSTLEKVISARNGAVSASAGGNVADIARKEGELSAALGRLFALTENYPALKANDSVKSLMEELSHTENNVSFARQLYNDMATRFNIKQQVFPNNMLAPAFGFKPAELFEIPRESAAERQAPKVDLTI